jgi:hypothetical protein
MTEQLVSKKKVINIKKTYRMLVVIMVVVVVPRRRIVVPVPVLQKKACENNHVYYVRESLDCLALPNFPAYKNEPLKGTRNFKTHQSFWVLLNSSSLDSTMSQSMCKSISPSSSWNKNLDDLKEVT